MPSTIRLANPSPHQGRTLGGSYTSSMVVGREAELRRVTELLAGARLRRGGALVVTGEAGVGKSTLLDEVAALAAGAAVVRVVGTQAEQEVPYAALGLVLGDVTDQLDRLPVPQGRALGVALALRDGDPPPAFAVGAATLAVLTRRAEDGPLVVLLDDAHLLDQPSARALAFAARRLGADPVLVVAAIRSGEGGPLAEAGLPELAVTGLDAAAVGSLMATLGLPATAEAAARARVVTAGNPLAVTELVRRPDALARLALDDPIPLSGRLVEVFAEQAGELGADVQLVVALTALAGGSATLVVDAARALGLDGDHVAPRHPLVGSAVYSSLSPEQQRRLHAAVAQALPPARTDERARHLAAAAARRPRRPGPRVTPPGPPGCATRWRVRPAGRCLRGVPRHSPAASPPGPARSTPPGAACWVRQDRPVTRTRRPPAGSSPRRSRSRSTWLMPVSRPRRGPSPPCCSPVTSPPLLAGGA